MNWPDNKPGFERLMKLYGNDVYRMAVLKLQDAEEAKDVYQTVFLKMYCCRKDFESDTHILHWLLKVTVNECINIHRSSWHRNVITGTDEQLIETADKMTGIHTYTGSNNSISSIDSGSGVWDAVSRLPQRYRDVIYLYYYEELSTAEIASILGIMQTGVRSRLKRARDILKKGAENYEF
ncbi:MAG: RNA polymerase sigma factor [Bacteroides sp.]